MSGECSHGISDAHVRALHTICERLGDGTAHWALTGSLSFALQGLPVEVNDVDIQADAAGAYEIERRFAELVTQPVAFSCGERIRSHFGALCIEGIRVEIMGDIEKCGEDGTWEAPPDLEQHTRTVELEGMRVPVLCLEYECEAYRKLGRTKTAEMLRRWLEGRGG